jgi:hypothetical protein
MVLQAYVQTLTRNGEQLISRDGNPSTLEPIEHEQNFYKIQVSPEHEDKLNLEEYTNTLMEKINTA